MSVFLSYCHAQADWVRTRLLPCLKAGGVEVRIDVERFRSGVALERQMDAEQDASDKHLLVLSTEYLASKACQREMKRAIAKDRGFRNGIVIPVRRAPCALPPSITIPNPLWIEMIDDRQPAPWARLLADCGADLGTSALTWLQARDEAARQLQNGDSFNFVVRDGVKTRAWEALLADVQDIVGGLPRVDLASATAGSRSWLVRDMLEALGLSRAVPERPNDLPTLAQAVKADAGRWLGLTRFHHVPAHADLDDELFIALRDLVQLKKHLRVAIQSRVPLSALLPPLPIGSEFELPVVELRSQP